MDVKLPNLGEGADSGTVVNLFVKEGDTITKDQPIIELENEKAVATIPSTASGVISKIHVKNGDKISAGHRL
ncbi:MAG: catalytic domain of component of various dehydrogenase complexe, partial [Pedosphaera sp.]|nr:catalytic domain of component of various dehydrogenase complexe [Pedosphaera sp.]